MENQRNQMCPPSRMYAFSIDDPKHLDCQTSLQRHFPGSFLSVSLAIRFQSEYKKPIFATFWKVFVCHFAICHCGPSYDQQRSGKIERDIVFASVIWISNRTERPNSTKADESALKLLCQFKVSFLFEILFGQNQSVRIWSWWNPCRFQIVSIVLFLRMKIWDPFCLGK